VLPTSDEAEVCPVCEQKLGERPPRVEQLRNSLLVLEDQIAAVERERPGLVGVSEELDMREGALRARLSTNRSALEELAAATEAVEEHQGKLDLGAWVRGRVDHFLESADRTGENGDAQALETEHAQLAAEIRALEEELDPARVRDAATSVLIQIGRPMTEMARRLGLEHSEAGVRVDLGRLTVVADLPTGPVYMDTGIGSAKSPGFRTFAAATLRRSRSAGAELPDARPTDPSLLSLRPTHRGGRRSRSQGRAGPIRTGRGGRRLTGPAPAGNYSRPRRLPRGVVPKRCARALARGSGIDTGELDRGRSGGRTDGLSMRRS
jgi:hypothetical protein